MQVSTSIKISAPKEVVWSTITDIENSCNVVSSILSIEILHSPESGINGLKWKETRRMFGKEASEIMWITESKQNEYYCTRAQSHGSVYITRLSLTAANAVTTLTMSFSAEPQTLLAKMLSFFMSRFIVKSMSNELSRDLNDIKNHIERS